MVVAGVGPQVRLQQRGARGAPVTGDVELQFRVPNDERLHEQRGPPLVFAHCGVIHCQPGKPVQPHRGEELGRLVQRPRSGIGVATVVEDEQLIAHPKRGVARRRHQFVIRRAFRPEGQERPPERGPPPALAVAVADQLTHHRPPFD